MLISSQSVYQHGQHRQVLFLVGLTDERHKLSPLSLYFSIILSVSTNRFWHWKVSVSVMSKILLCHYLEEEHQCRRFWQTLPLLDDTNKNESENKKKYRQRLWQNHIPYLISGKNVIALHRQSNCNVIHDMIKKVMVMVILIDVIQCNCKCTALLCNVIDSGPFSITSHPIVLIAILAMMSFWTFITDVILYLLSGIWEIRLYIMVRSSQNFCTYCFMWSGWQWLMLLTYYYKPNTTVHMWVHAPNNQIKIRCLLYLFFYFIFFMWYSNMQQHPVLGLCQVTFHLSLTVQYLQDSWIYWQITHQLSECARF